jgi:segregation and condensation protein A
MSFQIKMDQFEGPLDLLLTLIESKKLHISEIALRDVTEEYLSYIQSLEHQKKDTQKMHDQSQFIVIAATLILIKAKSLIPTMELSDEETESIDDLTERLRLYEIITRYSELLRKQITTTPVFFIGNPPKEKKQIIFAPHESVTVTVLETILQELLAVVPENESLPKQSIRKVLSLTEVMQKVEQTLRSGGTIHMREITDRYHQATDPAEKREAKVFAVLSFLAVLEMVKKAQIVVEQSELFQDIVVNPYQSS